MILHQTDSLGEVDLVRQFWGTPPRRPISLPQRVDLLAQLAQLAQLLVVGITRQPDGAR